MFRRLRLTRQAIDSLHYLGKATCARGDLATTRALMDESLAISKAHGYQCETADALSILGAVLRRQGDYERAAVIYEESLALYGGRGTRSWLVGRDLRNLGHIAFGRGDLQQAGELLRESLEILQETAQRTELPGCLAGIGGVAVAMGNPAMAARLLGAAHALVEARDGAWEPEEQIEFERYLAAARGQLMGSAFAVEWEAGVMMTLDDAIREALACAGGEACTRL
jgi:tetratricopeptide (TPR) repeat protein